MPKKGQDDDLPLFSLFSDPAPIAGASEQPAESRAPSKPKSRAKRAQPIDIPPADEDPVLAAVAKARKALANRNADIDSGRETPAAPLAPSPPRHYTVSELTQEIRGVLEPAFTQVWVKGEVSNYRPQNSGHAYFSLKDAGSAISAAFFGWGSRRQKFELKDGLQVLCRGKISVYQPRGTYQIVLDQIEPLGAGLLQISYEQLKAKLAGEGLFESSRKRALPPYPTRIAVVTSPSGAVIRDMVNILQRRAPHIVVTIIPAIVQGDGAPAAIMRGLELANRHSLGDLVVLARGGGSIEDLWGFNDEALARAIAASRLPVISAVGHEVDFTIADFVADLRAPTPSAAAEIISGQWVACANAVRDARTRLISAITRDLSVRRQLLTHVSARVINPRDRLREQAQRLDELVARMERALRGRLDGRRATLEQLSGKLDALSPLRVLERGYAIIQEDSPQSPGTAQGQGAVVRSAGQLAPGRQFKVTFHDGQRSVQAL